MNLKICPYCGVEILIQEEDTYLLKEKDILEKKLLQLPINDPIDISGIDSNDLFLFTDPKAIKNYEKHGRLEDLRHDIKFSVMRGKLWNDDELEYAAEIERLLKQGIIEERGSYWWVSPHPTVYSAKMRGYIRINGKAHRFLKGSEITFQCRMARDQRNLNAPLLIKKFTPTNNSMLCGEMKGSMKGM
ncbi:MAG TPA: hypothetical protein ENH75_14495 [archaeon]|nr:hypothetical protein [archaeon]